MSNRDQDDQVEVTRDAEKSIADIVRDVGQIDIVRDVGQIDIVRDVGQIDIVRDVGQIDIAGEA